MSCTDPPHGTLDRYEPHHSGPEALASGLERFSVESRVFRGLVAAGRIGFVARAAQYPESDDPSPKHFTQCFDTARHGRRRRSSTMTP